MHDLSFWLLLAATPGAAMLVVLGIHYLKTPHNDTKAISPVAPLVEMESCGLEQFTRQTIEQITAISSALSDCATAAKHVAPQDPPAHPSTLGGSVETTRNDVLDKDLAVLVANMREMAALTARLHDERQHLVPRTVTPVLVADSAKKNRCYLSFTLREEQFAVRTLSVCGVVEASQLITKASMPPKLRRAIKLGGALVPVIDLGVYLGGQPIEIGRRTSIVILEVTLDERAQMIGVVVDSVGKVEEIPPSGVESREAFDSEIHKDFTVGTITVNNHTVTLLDIGRGLLTHEFVAGRAATPSQAQENISRG
ncbi:chemotaxis protein CheW [Pseudomonas sp. dw_612]|uniref:chemotaxis protein CheW n=1 Tax=Pseudomonas sp. dw_612 TaxID=2720080 RepID=UPI001BD24595|nr:chemotaxis protein CheW [Pseudomonas sp. dw_612]